MTTASELAAAAADECRRILAEKDRLLEQARDERDAARDRADAAERERDEWSERHRQQRAAIVAAQDARAAAERALSEARGLAEEMIGYVPDYFREKWDFDARLAALPAPVPPGETRPDPTHRCKGCGALWTLREWPFDWALWSAKAGPCCDNAPMGDQIEAISGFHRLCDPGPFGGPAAPAAHPETTPEVDHE